MYYFELFVFDLVDDPELTVAFLGRICFKLLVCKQTEIFASFTIIYLIDGSSRKILLLLNHF